MSNYNQTIEASSAKTNTAAGTTIINRDCTGVVIAVKTTAHSGTTPTLVVKLQGSVNGTDWYDITGAATGTINTDTTTYLTVYPGATVAANSVLSQPLPRLWRAYWTIGGTTPSFTFSIDAAMLQ